MHAYTAAEETLDGVNIYRHRLSVEGRGVLGLLLEYASALCAETVLAWKAWRRHGVQIIHLCNPPDLLFLVACPFKLLGVRVVYDVHDLCPEMFEAKFGRSPIFGLPLRLAQRLSYACADAVLVTNETSRQVAIRVGGHSPASVFVVRTAPRIPGSEGTRDESLRKGRRYLVGYVGVMGSADGVDRLLEAADYLVHVLRRTDVQFLLMGSGPEYQALLGKRRQMGLEAVIDMPGWAYDDFLFTALRTIDVGVTCDPPNPYNHSCTMNKVLEYMAVGKPQVMTDLKESRVSAGECARYVTELTPAALGDAIVDLLESPDARERMGRVALDRFRREMSWDASVTQLLQAYAFALSRRKTQMREPRA
jgi:glycosyltransferase involved in cell wall biosynthesis